MIVDEATQVGYEPWVQDPPLVGDVGVLCGRGRDRGQVLGQPGGVAAMALDQVVKPGDVVQVVAGGEDLHQEGTFLRRLRAG
jgi:hypothetical protein